MLYHVSWKIIVIIFIFLNNFAFYTGKIFLTFFFLVKNNQRDFFKIFYYFNIIAKCFFACFLEWSFCNDIRFGRCQVKVGKFLTLKNRRSLKVRGIVPKVFNFEKLFLENICNKGMCFFNTKKSFLCFWFYLKYIFPFLGYFCHYSN